VISQCRVDVAHESLEDGVPGFHRLVYAADRLTDSQTAVEVVSAPVIARLINCLDHTLD
jgi:hypothetical protein